MRNLGQHWATLGSPWGTLENLGKPWVTWRNHISSFVVGAFGENSLK